MISAPPPPGAFRWPPVRIPTLKTEQGDKDLSAAGRMNDGIYKFYFNITALRIEVSNERPQF
jgi:hypothetical protein